MQQHATRDRRAPLARMDTRASVPHCRRVQQRMALLERNCLAQGLKPCATALVIRPPAERHSARDERRVTVHRLVSQPCLCVVVDHQASVYPQAAGIHGGREASSGETGDTRKSDAIQPL